MKIKIKEILVELSNELSKKIIDETKIQKLLAQTDIPPTQNPFELTHHVLKRLHRYQETS